MAFETIILGAIGLAGDCGYEILEPTCSLYMSHGLYIAVNLFDCNAKRIARSDSWKTMHRSDLTSINKVEVEAPPMPSGFTIPDAAIDTISSSTSPSFFARLAARTSVRAGASADQKRRAIEKLAGRRQLSAPEAQGTEDRVDL